MQKIQKEQSHLTLSRDDPLKVTRLTDIEEEESEEEDQPCAGCCRKDFLIAKKKYQHSAASKEGPESYAGNEILTSDEIHDYYGSLAPQMYERIMTGRNISQEEENRTRERRRTQSFEEETGKEKPLGDEYDAYDHNEENGNKVEEDEEIIFDLEL